ncbi:MAG: 6-phosphofructokinase [Puniceicoccales bacterium]|jgi:6-phosphofructokinase 1|nr:6-phosphofructokinase [Puniceicoccales bacterium]
MAELSGNVLILQIGRPSAITNVILAGLIRKSLNYDCIGEIYGCIGGIQSLMNEQFVDLAGQQQKNVANLVGTPGAALKSIPCEGVEAPKVAEIFHRHNVRYLFIIGEDSDSSRCAQWNDAAKAIDHEMCVMLIPTSVTNGMQLTDHCLGYGSMAKHLAVTAKSVVANLQSTQTNGAITILELGECENAWLIGSLALARIRKDSQEAPHLTILSRFDEGTFVRNVHQTIRNVGNCVIATGSSITNIKGDPIPSRHGVAEHIRLIAKANFDVQVDVVTLHDWELTSCMTLSGTDVAEAELCVQKTVELAVSGGISGKMMTLLRSDSTKYSSEVSCVDLENVSAKEKEFPESWYSYDEMALDVSFFKYAGPLIVGEVKCAYENGLPSFAKLK